MAVKVNSSEKQVVASNAKWTGIANMRVTMINPSKAEMEAAGMQVAKDPEYMTEKDGKKSYRLDFYLNKDSDNQKIFAKVAFFIEDKVRWNKDNTKVEWINIFGQTSWSTSETEVPSYEWFKKDGARPALIGEGLLTTFISNWANTDRDSQAALDEPKALANGNIAELRSLLQAIPKNEIQVLLGVKEYVNNSGTKAYYQDVYTGYFDRPYCKSYDKWKKTLEGEYGAFKSDYQGDLHLKIYEGNSTVAQDAPTNLDTPSGAPAVGQPFRF